MAKVATARRLRKSSTDAELKLWQCLRDRRLDGLKWKRQFIIEDHVADFACWDARLVVEVDGGQHAALQEQDASRTRAIESAGFVVLRFWNNEVMTNIEGVLTTILDAIVSARRNPSPQPSPQGRGGAGGTGPVNIALSRA